MTSSAAPASISAHSSATTPPRSWMDIGWQGDPTAQEGAERRRRQAIHDAAIAAEAGEHRSLLEEAFPLLLLAPDEAYDRECAAIRQRVAADKEKQATTNPGRAMHDIIENQAWCAEAGEAFWVQLGRAAYAAEDVEPSEYLARLERLSRASSSR
jgi:hypothetical protein